MIRPPIVVILGHVDHGKTSLLDFIRKSHLTNKEAGGITQKIGAYEIDTKIKGYKNSKITFIDTPGHEAFSLLRARGANIADIAILVVDGKDSVMPQTAESISHIISAKIPFIVAINKIDLPESNPDKVKNDLIKYDVLVEGKGGNIPTVDISAKTGKGVTDLLETILLITADLNLSYDFKNPVQAYIIETKKDKRGVIVSIIIKDGQIEIGDVVCNGEKTIKIRSIINDLGNVIDKIIPATPAELLGFDELPVVGSLITSKPTTTPIISQKIPTFPKAIDIDSLLHPPKENKKLSLIIKTDSQGSLEAITNSFSNEVNFDIILKAVGDINKSDVFLAKTTHAIIVGFSIKVPSDVADLAKQEKVIIKTYNIIYDLLDEVNEVSKLLKEKEEKEKSYKGEAKILATFIIEGEKIYGVKVTKGKINLNDNIELYRQDKLIAKTRLVSLKTRAKLVPEVKKSQEAGMVFGPPLDISIGDVIKSIS